MKFKKHKFISAEKLAKTFFGAGVEKIGIGLEEGSLLDVSNIERTGFAQYAFTETEGRTFVIKCLDEDIKSEHNFSLKLSEIWRVKGFEYLKGYSKIKPLYIVRDCKGEKMNVEGLAFPSGKINCEFLGLLVKGEKKK